MTPTPPAATAAALDAVAASADASLPEVVDRVALARLYGELGSAPVISVSCSLRSYSIWPNTEYESVSSCASTPMSTAGGSPKISSSTGPARMVFSGAFSPFSESMSMFR